MYVNQLCIHVAKHTYDRGLFCFRHKGFLKDCPDGLLTEQVSYWTVYN